MADRLEATKPGHDAVQRTLTPVLIATNVLPEAPLVDPDHRKMLSAGRNDQNRDDDRGFGNRLKPMVHIAWRIPAHATVRPDGTPLTAAPYVTIAY